MAMVKCRQCGAAMSSNATTCQACGSPRTQPLTWFILGFIVLVVLCLIYWRTAG